MSDEANESHRLAIQVENLRTRVDALEGRMSTRELSAAGIQEQLTQLRVDVKELGTRVGFFAAGIGIASGGISSIIAALVVGWLNA